MICKCKSTERIRAQILEQWDRCSRDGLFPYFATDENGAFARAHLTAFRGSKEWLVVFEVLSYVGEVDKFINMIWSYGNKVRQHIKWVEFLRPVVQHPNDQGWLPNPFNFEVMLYDKLCSFAPSKEHYIQANIDLGVSISNNTSMDRSIYILRLLATILSSNELFLPKPHLLEVAGRPPTLPVFLQLNKWQHPNPDNKEKPSDSLCLKSLANALAHNRANMYECSENLMNTHWSYWPNYLRHSNKSL